MLGGRRYHVTGRTRAEAVAKLRELVGRFQAGSLAPPSPLTFAHWAGRWLEGCRTRLRPKTLQSYEAAVRALLPLLGRLRLDRLRPLHVRQALLALQGQGRGSRFLVLCHQALSACLAEAVRLGLLGANPCASVPPPRHERGEAKDWTLEDMRRFLRACLEDTRPTARMLAFLLLSGLRLGEALGLQWSDVDLERGSLTVRRSLSYVSGQWHGGRPKSRSGERTIALPSLAVGLLLGLERRLPWVFWHERPPVPSTISRLMAELCQRAGVPRRPAHYLRHAHASLLAASGLDVKTLQRRLGHAQASVTLDVYAYAISEMDRRAAEMVDGALG
jgi:integrase